MRCSVPFDVEWEIRETGAVGSVVGASVDPILNFWMTVDGELTESWQWPYADDPPEYIYGVSQGAVHSCIGPDHGEMEPAVRI